MSHAGERQERTVSDATLKSDRHLNRAQALLDAEIKRYHEHGLTGKVTLELFFTSGQLEQEPLVHTRVACKA